MVGSKWTSDSQICNLKCRCNVWMRWNPRIVMMPTLSSPMSPETVVMTTYAAGDEIVGIMKALKFLTYKVLMVKVTSVRFRSPRCQFEQSELLKNMTSKLSSVAITRNTIIGPGEVGLDWLCKFLFHMKRLQVLQWFLQSVVGWLQPQIRHTYNRDFLFICILFLSLIYIYLGNLVSYMLVNTWPCCRLNSDIKHQQNTIIFGSQFFCFHDDVIKWEHFPRYWSFVRGIHRSPVDSPHKGQWLMFSLMSAWTNDWANNREVIRDFIV